MIFRFAINVGIALYLASILWVGAAPLNGEEFPPPGKYINIGKHHLHLHCIGQGSPTVILDAGLGGTSLEWVLVQPDVAQFTRVCSYDRSGYGWSEGIPGPRTSAIIVKELQKLLDFADEQSPYLLVGHSFGGLSMRLFASHHPDKIAGLVLSLIHI